MDPDCEPLETFLAPVIERCGGFEFEKLRFRWYRTVEFATNWKVMLEGFNEAYHVQQTHPQFLEFLEDYSNRSEESRVGKGCVSSVNPGGGGTIKKKHE